MKEAKARGCTLDKVIRDKQATDRSFDYPHKKKEIFYTPLLDHKALGKSD